jgi:hypothetical protein
VAGYAQWLATKQTEIAQAKLQGTEKINQATAHSIPNQRQFFRGSPLPKPEADVNCSVCTAAAVARKRTGGAHWNTQTVNQVIGETGNMAFAKWRRKTDGGLRTQLPGDAPNSDKDLQDQVDGIAEWCSRTLGIKRRKIIGSASSPVSSSFALASMKAQDEGTLFAVYVYVPLFTAYDPVAHWIFAEKQQGNIKFIDYQTDKAEVLGSSPTISDQPMKGGGLPMPGEYRMIVIAFLPDQAPKPLTGGRLI